MTAYIGSIVLFCGNFNPVNFQLCQGQVLPISSNAALFSILGTFYGGNGQSTLSLTDLRGRAMVGQGQSPGLSDYFIGEQTGTEKTALLFNNIPSHNHLMNA